MNGPDEPSARLHAARGTGHLLLYASLGLAVAAAATLALGADDARLLRLGVLVALWAALLGAFAAVKMRREATAGAGRTEAGRTEADRAEAGRAEDPSTIYRLELERDIAARREHELTVERELRREAKEDNRDELEAVRAELRSLRENLQQLFGGELLVERVAVRAESTRVRSLPERRRTCRPRSSASWSRLPIWWSRTPGRTMPARRSAPLRPPRSPAGSRRAPNAASPRRARRCRGAIPGSAPIQPGGPARKRRGRGPRHAPPALTRTRCSRRCRSAPARRGRRPCRPRPGRGSPRPRPTTRNSRCPETNPSQTPPRCRWPSAVSIMGEPPRYRLAPTATAAPSRTCWPPTGPTPAPGAGAGARTTETCHSALGFRT